MKLATLLSDNFGNSFAKLIRPAVGVSLSMKVRLNVKKLFKFTTQEGATYEEMRKELLTELAEKDEKGEPIVETVKKPIWQNGKLETEDTTQYKLSPENQALFVTKLTELQSAEVTPPVKIAIDDLGENNGLDVADLIHLEDIFDES